MNTMKKLAGLIWIALGPVACFYLVKTALHEVSMKPTIDTKIQWGVFVGVFIPIAFGIMLFGYYALRGEYDHLPQSSDELKD